MEENPPTPNAENQITALALRQNCEIAQAFGPNVASKLSGAAAEFGEACAFLDSPEAAQRLLTLHARQLQEFINTMAKILMSEQSGGAGSEE